jgi:hypothetical protein
LNINKSEYEEYSDDRENNIDIDNNKNFENKNKNKWKDFFQNEDLKHDLDFENNDSTEETNIYSTVLPSKEKKKRKFLNNEKINNKRKKSSLKDDEDKEISTKYKDEKPLQDNFNNKKIQNDISITKVYFIFN